jgi:hypothetical protein
MVLLGDIEGDIVRGEGVGTDGAGNWRAGYRGKGGGNFECGILRAVMPATIRLRSVTGVVAKLSMSRKGQGCQGDGSNRQTETLEIRGKVSHGRSSNHSRLSMASAVGLKITSCAQTGAFPCYLSTCCALNIQKQSIGDINSY